MLTSTRTLEYPGAGHIAVDGIKTFFVKKGTGYPIFLLHGGAPGASTLVNWRMVLGPLAGAGFAVYGFDQPGFGYTDDPLDFSVEYRVRHARAFIDYMGPDRYCVIGNSQGAYIAARIALEDPRAGELVLVSSGTLAPEGSEGARELARRHSEELNDYAPSRENMAAMTRRTLYDQSLVTDDLIDERYKMSVGRYAVNRTRRQAAPAARPVYAELHQLAARTLLLAGTQDRGVATERMLELFQSIPGAELMLFDRCGHWVQWDKADRFCRVVSGFLADAAAGKGTRTA